MELVAFADGSGVLERHQRFGSGRVARRHVDVWLPPGAREQNLRLPVIYMHDGQNLFDPATAYNGIDWGMDEAILKRTAQGRDQGAIVVGLWHSDTRWQDYMPARLYQPPSARPLLPIYHTRASGPPRSDDYLKFIVEEVKPFIDGAYPTRPSQADTFIMGSSMGGLISLYALETYPQVFGGAGCLSTHWIAGKDALVDDLGAGLPPAGRHKLYFDYGTETLDAAYEPYQLRMDERLAAAGYSRGRDWLTLKFQGAAHAEPDWRARVHRPLNFLLDA